MYMYEMYVRFEHCGGKYTSIHSYLQLFRLFFEHYFILHKLKPYIWSTQSIVKVH